MSLVVVVVVVLVGMMAIHVVGEWVVETVGMVTIICKVVGGKEHILIKITSMPILKQSLAV